MVHLIRPRVCLLGLTPALTTPVAAIQALSSLLPAVAEKKLDKGGFLVLRPDSGVQTTTYATGKWLRRSHRGSLLKHLMPPHL